MKKEFEAWMKVRHPRMPLDYNEQEQYFYHDIAQLMWLSWQAARGLTV